VRTHKHTADRLHCPATKEVGNNSNTNNNNNQCNCELRDYTSSCKQCTIVTHASVFTYIIVDVMRRRKATASIYIYIYIYPSAAATHIYRRGGAINTTRSFRQNDINRLRLMAGRGRKMDRRQCHQLSRHLPFLRLVVIGVDYAE